MGMGAVWGARWESGLGTASSKLSIGQAYPAHKIKPRPQCLLLKAPYMTEARPTSLSHLFS